MNSLTNQTALFQPGIAMLLSNLFMTKLPSALFFLQNNATLKFAQVPTYLKTFNFIVNNKGLCKDGSPGLVVMGVRILAHILDGHFSHLFVAEIVMCV